MKPVKLLLIVLAIAGTLLTCGLLSGAENPKFTATVDGATVKVTPVLPAGAGAVWYRTTYADGKFTGTLITAAGSVPAVWEVQFAISVRTNPIPPVPVPPDPPVPIVKPVAVYLIYESRDLTPATAAVRDGLAWKKTATDLGVRWLCMDQDQGKQKFPQATARAVAVGLPAVVFVDAQGVPDVVKMPATAAEMETLVKAKGGAK